MNGKIPETIDNCLTKGLKQMTNYKSGFTHEITIKYNLIFVNKK